MRLALIFLSMRLPCSEAGLVKIISQLCFVRVNTQGSFLMTKIITISREFGSGGRETGRRLAEAMKIAYYDQEIEEYVRYMENKDIFKNGRPLSV